jgi:hypothetical protein
MITFLSLYLIVQTICVIWFYSPFRISIGQLLFDRQIDDYDKFELYVMMKSPLIGKLLSCYICFSFWTSLIVGGISVFTVGTPYWYPFFCGLTLPSLCYLYKSIINNNG